MRKFPPCIVLFSLFLPSAFAGITLSSPSNGATVSSPAHFVASASSGCSKGVAAMGVYDNNVLMMTSGGSKLDTQVALSSGTHRNTVVQYWDHCGGSGKVQISLNVDGTSADNSGGFTFANLEDKSGWLGYGELAPVYDICTDCRPKVTWGFKQGITDPAVGATSTRFDVGGSVKYSDALFVNHLLGDGSPTPDPNATILSSIHQLTYDVWFFGSHLELAHALEFDIGLNFNGRAMMFGTECRMEGNEVWALWDNPNHKWVDTQVPCKAVNGKWNHLVLQFHRTDGNYLVYDSITLNGTTNSLGWKTNSVPHTWHGLVVNFQLDGNGTQADYSVYIDKLNITYK